MSTKCVPAQVFAMKRAIEVIGGIADGIELLLLCLLVVVGPFIWFYWLVKAHRFESALTVALFWLASTGIVGREVRRKAITAVSLFVFLVWLVALILVFRAHFA